MLTMLLTKHRKLNLFHVTIVDDGSLLIEFMFINEVASQAMQPSRSAYVSIDISFVSLISFYIDVCILIQASTGSGARTTDRSFGQRHDASSYGLFDSSDRSIQF
jgi:hypothetical protein